MLLVDTPAGAYSLSGVFFYSGCDFSEKGPGWFFGRIAIFIIRTVGLFGSAHYLCAKFRRPYLSAH